MPGRRFGGTGRGRATPLTTALLLWALGALAPGTASAQTASHRPWTVGPYVAGTATSAAGTRWGLSPNRRHVFVGVHATIAIVEGARLSFRYAPEIVPLLIVTNNPKYHVTPSEDGESLTVIEQGRGPVAGFGISPIGFEGRLRMSSRWTSYGAGALGAVWFTREVPILNARLFNFTAEFGGGLLWSFRPGVALRLGYKFHHLSNARTAAENPGIDGHALVVGIERSFGG